MIIGFDVDFTITTGKAYEATVKQYFPNFEIQKHYTKYPLEYALMKHGFISDTNPFDRHNMYKKHKDFIFGDETISLEFLKVHKMLEEQGIEMHFITARDSMFKEATEKCFTKHNLSIKNVHHLGHYRKYDLINELGIELFYEDNINNSLDIISNTNCEVRIKEQPYNIDLLNGLQSFKTWGSEYYYLDFLLKNISVCR